MSFSTEKVGSDYVAYVEEDGMQEIGKWSQRCVKDSHGRKAETQPQNRVANTVR